MKILKYIIFGLLFLFVCRYIYLHNVGENELWVEDVDIEEGGYIEILHSHRCKRSKPFSIDKIDKIEFRKNKFSVFDICILDEEVKMLNAISKYNITKSIKDGYIFGDIGDVSRYEDEICDLSNRDYEVGHSWIGTKTKVLSKKISAWSLLDDMGRDFKW